VQQLEKLKNFFLGLEKTLIINRLNDNVDLFYNYLIKFYANKSQINIQLKESFEKSYDLFSKETFDLFYTNNPIKIDELIEIKNNKIIFMDYKSYKKFSQRVTSLNSYQFENDIDNFVKNELGIKNTNLMLFCKNNPALVFSETSKYLLNSNNYHKDSDLSEEEKKFVKTRRLINNIKKDKFVIKNLYHEIKNEAIYKKLSFLTY
jgi:hypothetical protein